MIQDTEGKCLTFAFGPEEYALEILKVREIMVILEMTATEAASEQDKQ